MRSLATSAIESMGTIASHTNHCFAHDEAVIHSSNTRNAVYIL
jgi:hypothetical protein